MNPNAEPNHVLRGYRAFVMVPLDVLDVLDDPVTLATYVRLRQHADRHGTGAHPSRQRLASLIGHSTPKGVDKGIGRLVELGLVDVFQRWRTPEGAIAFESAPGAAQTSNGYVVYDEPGAGSGAGIVAAPPEAREGVGVVVGGPGKGGEAPSPVGETPLPSRVHPPYPVGGPPRTRVGTRTRSLNQDPLNQTPLPPAADSDEVGAREVESGEGDSSSSGTESRPAADAAGGDSFAVAASIVQGWAEKRSSALTASTRRGLVSRAAEALGAGHGREVVERALVAWDDGTSRSPGRLPYLVDQEAGRRSSEASSAADSRAEAKRTAAMLDEMNANRVEPGSFDPSPLLQRALSPEAWARRQARLRGEGD